MKQRLINCDFLNGESFKDKLSNKAKLLFLFMFFNADDKGFVSNTNSLIQSFEQNDQNFNGTQINMALLGNDYQSAKNELLDRGFLYEFADKYGNKVYLIRSWYLHNRYVKGLRTNYYNFLKQVEVIEGEYKLKENKVKEIKLKEIKVNDNKYEEIDREELLKQLEEGKEEW